MRDLAAIRQQILSADGKRLSLGELKYTNKEDADAILQTIRENPQLEAISLDNLSMATQWMEPIVEAAAACPHLRDVSLSGNPLSAKAAKHLTQALGQWPQLETLRLERTGLTPKSAAPLITALRGNSQLRSLSLSNNKLQDTGGEVADLMGALPRLRQLYLEDCQLTDTAIRRIGDALATTGRDIVTCSLHYNTAGIAASDYFAERIIGSQHRNLLSTPLDEDRLREYCGKQLEMVRDLITHLPEGDAPPQAAFDSIPAVALARMDSRLPALEAKTHPQELVPELTRYMDSLPNDIMDLRAADSRGYTPLDNPRTWLRIAEWQPVPSKQELLAQSRNCESLLIIGLARDAETVITGLNNHGIGLTADVLCDRQGKPSPVLQQLLEDGTAPLLFTAANWRGQPPQEMQRVYDLLPDAQRDAVSNYHTLRTRLGMEQQPKTSIGR